MARFDFTPIFNDYRATIARMPPHFNSHEFIKVLTQRNQRTYIEALYEYRPDTDPFQVVHGILSKQLHEHNNLVLHDGEVDSIDIFGNPNRCASWTKV